MHFVELFSIGTQSMFAANVAFFYHAAIDNLPPAGGELPHVEAHTAKLNALLAPSMLNPLKE